jgi:hypothetical protein
MIRQQDYVRKFDDEKKGTLLTLADLEKIKTSVVSVNGKSGVVVLSGDDINSSEESTKTVSAALADLSSGLNTAQQSADGAQDTADTALANAADAARDAANAQQSADGAQDTADEKVDAAYVDNAISQAVLSAQTWIAAVQTKAGLPDPSTLNPTVNYLCRVINDKDTPANNAVWQLIANAEEWTYFSNNLDFIDEIELADATEKVKAEAAEYTDSKTAAMVKYVNDKPPDESGNVTLYGADINLTADNPTPITEAFAGLKTELDAKQDKLLSGANIKTVNTLSLLGSGNIDLAIPTYKNWNVSDVFEVGTVGNNISGVIKSYGYLLFCSLFFGITSDDIPLAANTNYDLAKFKPGFFINNNGIQFVCGVRNASSGNFGMAQLYTNVVDGICWIRYRTTTAVTLNSSVSVRGTATIIFDKKLS